MNSKLFEHLQNRPIAFILNATNDKYNVIVLKLLSVIDYYIDTSGMYAEFKKMRKLLPQLLTFHDSFASFNYYSYTLPKEVKIENKLLMCKRCELLAPCMTTLEHMAFAHNIHVNVNLCAWCEKCEYQVHGDSSLDKCYEAYLKKHRFSSIVYPAVITFKIRFLFFFWKFPYPLYFSENPFHVY